MNQPPSHRLIVAAACVMLILLLACGGGRAVTPTRAPASAVQNSAATTASASEDVSESEPTIAPAPTEAPTAEPVAHGASRSNPLPLGSALRFTTWAITVTSVLRGEEAATAITGANQFNDAPPAGSAYLLATVQMQNIADKQEAQDASFGLDLRVTGERNVLYNRSSLVTPTPLEGQLFPGGSAEGQIAFVVPVDEGNLMFRVGESLSFDDEASRFVAIDEDAHVAVDPAIKAIAATTSGEARNAPVALGETVTTDDWEAAIIEVARGDKALQLAKEANQFNDPPEAGTEYVAIKLRARSIGSQKPDVAQRIDGSFLTITGEKNVVYERPSVVAPDPILDASLFPGGATEGWEVLKVATGEQKLVVIFEPLFSFGGDATRFLAIE